MPDMSESASPLRVLLLSAVGTKTNPYIGLLRDGLAAAGADVRLESRLEDGALAEFRPEVIHLHWLERYDLPPRIMAGRLKQAGGMLARVLRRGYESLANAPLLYAVRRYLRLERFFRALRRFQRAGGRVAYTVHNLDPHEDGGAVERWGARQMIRLADVIHVHDASTAAALTARFGRRGRIAVVPHGHYMSSYPNTIGRPEARAALGLPQDAFIFVNLGLLRPYKGLEELLPAFRALPAAGETGPYLLLAGKPGSEAYLRSLHALAAGDGRIRLLPEFVPPESVQTFLNAADVCVLPYRQITTSGAALLALSFGLPLIAPAIGAFPGLIAGRRGLLYDPGEASGLVQALAQAQQTDWTAARAEILAWVRQFDWQMIGEQLVAAYTGTG